MTDWPGVLETFPDVIQRTQPWYDQRCGLVTASVVGRLLTVRHLGAIEYDCPECDAIPNESCRSKTRAGRANKTVHPERTARAIDERASSPTIIEPARTDEARGVAMVAAAERISGFVDPTFVGVDMQRGVDDEPFAIDAYAEHHAAVAPCGFMIRTWDGGRLGYSPDGLVGDDGLIEIKSRRGRKHVETVIAGKVPGENMAQLQAGLLVSGRDWIDYISYSAGLHLWTVRVEPDEHWFAAIRAAVEAFEAATSTAVDAYRASCSGLPMTDRPLDLDMVI